MTNIPKRLTRPPRLQFGDVIGIVAPASPPRLAGAVTKAVAPVAKLGFQPRLAPHARRRLGFLAGTDAERAGDLMEMFLDPEIKGIFCLRGGYGSGRLLRQLDFAAIRRHPKVFIGYSDITALHCALVKHAGMICFHGPLAMNIMDRDGFPEFARHSLLRTIMEPSPAGSICAGYTEKTVRILNRGRATGRLVGGNLSVLCATLGTPFQPDFRGAILFLEDIGEEPYRLDRMLTHLGNAGVFEQVAGIAVGVNVNCQSKPSKARGNPRQTMEQVLEDRLDRLAVPVVTGLPFGHIPLNATLPMGGSATLDADHGDLIIDEPAVL